jgi:UDP-N-acetylmuramate--alanine ligase
LPALNVGAPIKTAPHEKKILISEACEYKRNFLYLKPDFTIVTNVDYDHPDCYSTLSSVKKAFGEFCAQSKLCFINADDVNSAYLLKRKNVVSYGFNAGEFRAEITAFTSCGYKFRVKYNGVKAGDFSLNLKGRHYLYDALAAVVAALCYGVSAGEIAEKLAEFCGVARRNEYVGKLGACAFYTDYAHHPKEIESELSLLKSQYDSICVAFQPHTFSRTRSMLPSFVKSLSIADLVLLVPTYAARESGEDGDELFRALSRKTQVKKVPLERLNDETKAQSVKFGAIAYVGAGNVDEEIRKLFDKKNPDALASGK